MHEVTLSRFLLNILAPSHRQLCRALFSGNSFRAKAECIHLGSSPSQYILHIINEPGRGRNHTKDKPDRPHSILNSLLGWLKVSIFFFCCYFFKKQRISKTDTQRQSFQYAGIALPGQTCDTGAISNSPAQAAGDHLFISHYHIPASSSMGSCSQE